MKKFIKGQSGFTLIEIIIVLAILAILAALIVPQLSGFLARGGRASYDADKHVLEIAVMAYYTEDPIAPEWPILGDSVGRPVDGNHDGDFDEGGDARNGIIDVRGLVGGGYIGGRDAIRSARGGPRWQQFATSEGSYIWYIADRDGTVRSLFWKNEPALPPVWVGGFQNVYP